MAERVYVPGFGYVTQGSAGTSGTVQKGPKQRVTGQEPRRPAVRPTVTSPSPHAALGVSPSQGFVNNQSTSETFAGFKATTGVPLPLSGYGGLGGLRGFEYGQRMGFSPDAFERFPYGVRYVEQGEATDSFLTLDVGYQNWLKGLAQNPAIGTKASTGRMLWERLSNLSAMRTENGDPVSPQQMAAELAASLGVPPPGGDASGALGTSSGGGYGGGGGGGGGGASMGSVSLTDPTSARGLLLQTMQGVLGRNPTDKEYNQFIKALNQAEMNAPRTVTVEGDVAVQSGGVDPGMVAMEYVEGLEEFDSAAGQRTLDAFMQVLGA